MVFTELSHGLFRHRDFNLLVVGQTISQLGSQISVIALPLVAVLTMDATPLQVALLGAASSVAFAIIGLPAGAWIDRMRRRPVLIASDLARGLLLASIPLAWMLGVLTITQLVFVALALGFARVFFDVSYQSYLPSLVGKDKLLWGNSTLETIRATGQFAGPGLGGFLVGFFGAATVILFDAASYLVSALSLAIIRTAETRPVGGAKTGLRKQIGDGLRFVLHQPILRAIALCSAVSNVAFMAAGAVTFIYIARDLKISPSLIGVLVSIGSVPAMLGAVSAPWLARRCGSVRIIWLSLAVTAPFELLVPLARPDWRIVLVVIGNAVFEYGQIIYSTANLSLRQAVCPDHMLGRMNATMRVLIMGAMPLGSLVGGLLGEFFGIRTTLWIVAVVLLCAWLPLLAPLHGLRDVSDLPAAGSLASLTGLSPDPVP